LFISVREHLSKMRDNSDATFSMTNVAMHVVDRRMRCGRKSGRVLNETRVQGGWHECRIEAEETI
jgi:hypothetical protein